jgi:hypothetical protein
MKKVRKDGNYAVLRGTVSFLNVKSRGARRMPKTIHCANGCGRRLIKASEGDYCHKCQPSQKPKKKKSPYDLDVVRVECMNEGDEFKHNTFDVQVEPGCNPPRYLRCDACKRRMREVKDDLSIYNNGTGFIEKNWR